MRWQDRALHYGASRGKNEIECCCGVRVLGPLVGGLTNKYGCRAVTMCGSVLSAVSVGVSSFSVNINMLIATYGLLAGQVRS